MVKLRSGYTRKRSAVLVAAMLSLVLNIHLLNCFRSSSYTAQAPLKQFRAHYEGSVNFEISGATEKTYKHYDTNEFVEDEVAPYALRPTATDKTCLIKFVNEKQLLCFSGTNSAIIPLVVQQLLEQQFVGCSATHIGVQNISRIPALRFDWQCLFAFEESPDKILRDGDDLWGLPTPTMSEAGFSKTVSVHQPGLGTLQNRDQILCALSKELYLGNELCDESLWFSQSSSIHQVVDAWNLSFPYHLFTTMPHIKSKNAVILLGNLRGGEQTWQTLYDNVLDVNNADLILATVGQTPSNQRSSSLYARAKFVVELPHYEDWADAIDLIVDGNQTWRKTVPLAIGNVSILLGQALGRREGSGALIFMARWFLKNYMQHFQFHALYDRFVVTRSDHFYKCQHDLTDLQPVHHIFVPNGEDWKGLCDRHFVISAKHVYIALNLLPPLIRHPERYAKLSTTQGFHPLSTTETFLRLRWGEDGLFPLVRRFSRPMFTCAVAGDNYLWSAPSKDITPEGVLVKYKMEYALARSECLQSYVKKKARPELVPDSFKTPPKGVLLKVTNSVLGGWACDVDDPLSAVEVQFLVNDTLHGNTMEIAGVANMHATKFIRKQCGGGTYHRFAVEIALPDSYIMACKQNRTFVHAFALDLIDSAIVTELVHSPTLMTVTQSGRLGKP